MDYERIHKVETGMISPSKLRMSLLGSHNQKKKDKSPIKSSRTSPAKLQDSEFVKNSLLAVEFDDDDVDDVSGLEVRPKEPVPRVNGDAGRVKMTQLSKVEGGNSSMVHPVRNVDDENLDYDSNASSSSFEFHKGDNNNTNRSLHNPVMGRSFQRQIPSKWNDAEKWIMSRQNSQNKRNASQNQVNRLVRVAPEYVLNDHKLLPNRISETKRVDFCQPMSQMGLEKFSFDPNSSLANGVDASTGTCIETKDLEEMEDQEELSCTTENSTGIPTVRSVSMRDMGTEMTPGASQEPSRTATPEGATTPLRSPTSSVPTTPKRGVASTSTPLDPTTNNETNPTENGLSEQDLKLKTRREIVALGVKLGKMNIANWASKDVKEKTDISSDKTVDTDELDRIEFERRAAAWEESEKSKHTARFKREDIKIQAWESQQKAKLEAEMRRIEAEVEQMRAHAQAKMVKKIAMARQRSEEKRFVAESRKNEQAGRTAAQAEYIRQTGRIPSSSAFMCCGWL